VLQHIARFTIALLVVDLGSAAYGQCNGEPAAGSACAPRVIPGSPGVYEVVMDVSSAVGAYVPACGLNVGHGVWFEVTPAESGQLTFSTCHPATGYDTVVQPWGASGDCEFPVRMDDLCTDDTADPACVNACNANPRSSKVTLPVNAGTKYLFEVGSYDSNSAGCALCLGARVTICGGDVTPPTVAISSPARLGCACNGLSVVGTVNDVDGGLSDYRLEYAADGSSTWSPIASGSSAIINGVLGTWNTAGLAQGYYTLRLTATNACGLSNSAVQTVWVDNRVDTLDFRSPSHGDTVGWLVCFDGTVFDSWCFDSYTAKFRPVFTSAFSPVDPSSPVYSSTVANDPFARWDTVGLGIPDGDFELQVSASTACENGASVTRVVTVDNTPPTAVITSPINCAYLDGIVSVFGTADDAHLTSWTLQYTGGGTNTWTTIATGQSPVVNNLLGEWDTSALPSCAYTLRLVVTDGAVLNCNGAISHRAEHTVSVNVGFCGDFDTDDDGDVDLFDYAAFETEFNGPQP